MPEQQRLLIYGKKEPTDVRKQLEDSKTLSDYSIVGLRPSSSSLEIEMTFRNRTGSILLLHSAQQPFACQTEIQALWCMFQEGIGSILQSSDFKPFGDNSCLGSGTDSHRGAMEKGSRRSLPCFFPQPTYSSVSVSQMEGNQNTTDCAPQRWMIVPCYGLAVPQSGNICQGPPNAMPTQNPNRYNSIAFPEAILEGDQGSNILTPYLTSRVLNNEQIFELEQQPASLQRKSYLARIGIIIMEDEVIVLKVVDAKSINYQIERSCNSKISGDSSCQLLRSDGYYEIL